MVLVNLGVKHEKGERLIGGRQEQQLPIPPNQKDRKQRRPGENQESDGPKAYRSNQVCVVLPTVAAGNKPPEIMRVRRDKRMELRCLRVLLANTGHISS